jgi:hypothetical protein
VSAPSHEPWKDTAAVHTTHDTPRTPIRHAHTQISYPKTWLGKLWRRAEALTEVRVPRGVLGLSPPDEPICPTTWHREMPLYPQKTRDDAWRYLVRQVRAHRGDWHLYAIGAMVPGLTGKALELAPKGSTRKMIKQAYRDLVGQFLVVIEDMDDDALAEPNVANRLIGRAHYYTLTRYHSDGRHADLEDRSLYTETGLRARVHPRGHPDFVLWRLVKLTKELPDGRRLTPTDAELVARSHMEYAGLWPDHHRKTIADAAVELGIELSGANMRRWRAEVIIARQMRRYTANYRIPDAAKPPQQPAA